MKKTCLGCYGSGKVMGIGMMKTECDSCEGKGHILDIEDEILELNKSNPESYKKAINEIKAVDKNITEDKAKELFAKEYHKLSKKK